MRMLIILSLGISLLSGQSWKSIVLLQKPIKGTQLDGSTQYWTKTSATSADFGTSTDFTIIAAFKSSSIATLQRVVAKKVNSAGTLDPGYMFEIRSGKTNFVIADAAGTISVAGTITLESDRWYIAVISATRAGSGVIYLNGVQDNTGTISTLGTITNALTLTIGANSSAANPFLGQLGPIQIISGKALTAAEAASVSAAWKKSGLPTSYTSGTIVASYNWRSAGTDISGTGNSLTPVASAPVVTIRP